MLYVFFKESSTSPNAGVAFFVLIQNMKCTTSVAQKKQQLNLFESYSLQLKGHYFRYLVSWIIYFSCILSKRILFHEKTKTYKDIESAIGFILFVIGT